MIQIYFHWNTTHESSSCILWIGRICVMTDLCLWFWIQTEWHKRKWKRNFLRILHDFSRKYHGLSTHGLQSVFPAPTLGLWVTPGPTTISLQHSPAVPGICSLPPPKAGPQSPGCRYAALSGVSASQRYGTPRDWSPWRPKSGVRRQRPVGPVPQNRHRNGHHQIWKV